MLLHPCRVVLLGALRLEQGETRIERFRTRHTASLLAYLTFYGDCSHSREELCERFWPDAAPESARHNLRQTLTTLRRFLEPTAAHKGRVLVGDHTHLRLNAPAVTSDVAEFTAALNAAERADSETTKTDCLARAVACYGGDLLPGHYDEWVLNERERLRWRFVSALLALGEGCEEAGDRDGAIRWGLAAAQADPLDESACGLLLRGWRETGPAARAAAHYQAYARRLAEELGLAPAPELQELAQSLAAPEIACVPPRPRPPRPRPPRPAASPPLPERPEYPLPEPLRRPARLPVALTPFFGRQPEIARTARLLACYRLVTLTGIGGSGKTRLALEVARHVAPDFPTIVWAALADVPRPEEIGAAIADALGSAPSGGDPLTAVSARFAALPAALLILDNFEHLLASGTADTNAASETIRGLLTACPGLTIFVTSRRRLGLSGEQAVPVRPLPLPTENSTADCGRNGEDSPIDALARCPAVQLFVNRAQAARADFALTRRNARDIAHLCRLLDGLPLAIELAAARIGAFTPARLCEELAQPDSRFALLVSRHRDAPARHQTLWAALEWSLGLLPPDAQAAFACLSTLHGIWTASAAQALTDTPDIVELLDMLCEFSLLALCDDEEEAGEEVGEGRYALLESVRQFARKQLPPDALRAASRRHAIHYLAKTNPGHPNGPTPDESAWQARQFRNLPNLRAALDWSFGPDGDATIGLRLCARLGVFWYRRGLWNEGRRYGEMALASPSGMEAPDARADVLSALAVFASLEPDAARAVALAQECLALRRDLPDRAALARTLHNLGHYFWLDGDHAQSEQSHRKALTIREALGDVRGMALSYNCLGTLAGCQGEWDEARRLHTENLILSRQAGDAWGEAGAKATLANHAAEAGAWDTARELNSECLAFYQAQGDVLHQIYSVLGLARVETSVGNLDEAARHFARVRLLVAASDSDGVLASVALFEAEHAARRGDIAAAKALYRESLTRHLARRETGNAARCIADLATLTLRPDNAAVSVLPPDSAGAAMTLLCAGLAQSKRLGLAITPLNQARYDASLQNARTILGAAEFARAEQEGRNMDWSDAVASAFTL